MNKCLFLLCLFFFMPVAEAHPAIGWLWYDALHANPPKVKRKASSKPTLSALLQMQQLQRHVREAKARAILHPTEGNVRAYIILQNITVAHATHFAAMWQKVLLDDPSLDYSILHPTENNAQHVLSVQERADEVAAIHHFAKHNGLLFFYRGNNRLDQALAPSILAFANTYHMALIPVSVDGKSLAIFPKSQRDHGQAKALQVRYFPALVLVNPKTGEHQAVAYGFIAQDELKRRFLNIATHFKRAV